METKECENHNTRPRRENGRKCVERLETKSGGNKYDTKFTRTGKKIKQFMHDIQKLAVAVRFTSMTSKKGIKKHGEIAVAAM